MDTARRNIEWSRRSAIAALGAIGGCAAPRPALVNLLQAPAEAAAEPLETAFDPAARMTAPVTLDDAGPFPFVVDTGANVSVASLELADRLQLPRTGTAPVHGIAGLQVAELTRVRRLAVGSISFSVRRMPLLPRDRLGADGLLGMDVLRGRRLVMDFRRTRIEIGRSMSRLGATPTRTRPMRQHSEPLFVVPARVRYGQLIIVDADIAGVRVAAFLDSGSQSTVGNLALKSAVARRNPNFAERLRVTTLVSATGQVAQAEIAGMPPLRLGGLLIGNITTAFADLHIFDLWGLRDRPAILVGMDVLRQFNSVEIDFGARQVTFRPPADAMTLRSR